MVGVRSLLWVGLGERVVGVGLLMLRAWVLLLLLLLRVMLRKMVHVRRRGQAHVRLGEEGVEFRGRVLLRVVVRWVLPWGFLLLPVPLTASPTPPCTARSTASVIGDTNICAGRLGKGALQHVQRGDHRALLDLTLLVWMGAVVVVSRCHFQSLGLQLELELGGLGLRWSLMLT